MKFNSVAPASVILALTVSSAYLAGAQDSKIATVKEGKHVRFNSQIADAQMGADITALLDTAWEMEQAVLPVRPSDSNEPRDVFLYSSTRNYVEAEKKLTGGEFKANLAFSHFESVSAHVALQPAVSPKAMVKFGLPLLTTRLLAHETAHVARFSTLPNHASHPRWLADGVASRVEELTLQKHNLITSAERDPFFSTYMVDALKLFEAGEVPSVKEILGDKLQNLSNRTMYGLRWLWVRFLCDTAPAGWKQIADEARRLGGGPQYSEELAGAVAKILQPAMPDADAKFRSYLRGLKPEWEEAYRSLATEGSIWKQAAFEDVNAIAWRTGKVGKTSYAITGQLQVLPGGKQQMNFLLGRASAGFVSIAFVANYGVTVFHFDAAANQWNKIGDSKVADLALEKWFDFRIEVKEGTLQVLVNENQAVNVNLPSHPMDGPWGVGAQAGSCGIWNEVEIN